MLKKDKEKVLDEVWTQERVKSFLNLKPVEGLDNDFHTLLTAYQSMRANDFELFVGFFCQQNRSLNTCNGEGETVLSIIEQHRHGKAYAEILKAART